MVTVVYEPKAEQAGPKVLLGKYIYPGESRQLTEKQAKALEGNKDFRIIRPKKEPKPKGSAKKDDGQQSELIPPAE